MHAKGTTPLFIFSLQGRRNSRIPRRRWRKPPKNHVRKNGRDN